MKKTLAMLMASTLLLGGLASCSSTEETGNQGDASQGNASQGNTEQNTPATSDTPVDLLVVTSYGGTDNNRSNFVDATLAFEAATGHTVLDNSGTSDETWKQQVLLDFQAGSEPDVLFFFTGVDANSLIEDKQVVSLEEIRAVYPDYASNMKDEMIPYSPYDNDQYAVPVNGFWEGMFVNTTVLDAAGVELPGADYTWDQFLVDCQAIVDAGYTPIGASLVNVPHYWFEFTTLNNGSIANHLDMPTDTSSDAVGLKWVAGMEDIKELYDLGFFPRNTLSMSDDEAVEMVVEGDAAFLIDGSWKISTFADSATPENFAVTYVPGKGDREATDVVGGISMGYYITRSAWEDPETQAAAVAYVEAMTTDEVVSKFSATSITALKNPAIAAADISDLELSAIEMCGGATGIVAPVQDLIDSTQRAAMFAGVQEVMAGKVTSQELFQNSLGIN